MSRLRPRFIVAAVLGLLAACTVSSPDDLPPGSTQHRAVAALGRPARPLQPTPDTMPLGPDALDESYSPPTKDSASYPVDSAGSLKLPVALGDACEGEDCQTAFVGVACEDGALRASESDDAPVVAPLHRLDTLQVTHRRMYVVPGMVVIRRDTLGFARGDTLRLLQYYELGLWHWWVRGQAYHGTEFWRGPESGELGGVTYADTTGAAAIALSHPAGTTWLSVQPRGGPAGWWRSGTPGLIDDVGRMQHWEEHCPLPKG